MTKFRIAVIVLSVIFLESCATLGLYSKVEYVKIVDSHFYIGEKPYFFLGTNFWYGAYIGSSGKTGNRERLVKELDLLKSLGIDNLRILAASEKSLFKNSLSPAIQTEPNQYDEEILNGLDFLLDEMRKREMKAVLFLNNYWEWSGGMNQYNFWTNGETVLPPKENFDWGEFMRTSATFYANDSANSIYRNYIKNIIQRKNLFNDYYYSDDPTIMSWQLANEPRPWGNDEQIKSYYEWIDSTSKFIRSLDKNHLISTGSEGVVGSLMSEEIYKTAHQSKFVDYLTFHLWAKNWNWYDANNPTDTYDSAKIKALNYIREHIKISKELNKPIVLEEFGIGRDDEKYSVESPVKIRNDYYEMIFKEIYDSATVGCPIAGSNFWGWGGYGRNFNNDFIWREGDDFTGDPPQEPQGLNSVFDTDESTLKLIKIYADKMKKIKLNFQKSE